MGGFLSCGIARISLTALFKPDPPIPVTISDPAKIRAQFRRWQFRVLFSTIVGYAIFYFVRQNLPMAMPAMHKGLDIDNEKLGRLLTLNGVLYGVSKFANGYLGDRANARAMMVVGLAGSAVLNILFGMSSTLVVLGVIWMLNGWFQGMGYPPCARLTTHWFPPKELATKMSIWNTSHSLGALLIFVLCGYLVAQSGWRACFFVPAGIALLGAWWLWRWLPDTPPSVGLPEVEGTHGASGAQTSAQFNSFLLKRVFLNKYVWLVSLSNFFVYTIRYAVVNWGPTLLTETKHLRIVHAGWMMAGFECAGLIGALISGWLADRYFAGRVMRVGVFYMAMAGLSVLLFWKVPAQSEWISAGLLCCTGFFIYGPQCLVSIAAANLAIKRAAATAVGLTSIFGYGSTVLSGWGLGWLERAYGWDAVFKGLLIIAALGVLVFAACWRAKAHGYDE
jgi:OPA family glycerol-3-phosphate transporter-like MFS transporter/OPA family sugar phosphate sensor protein UhpC-like MFS transporter